MNQQLNLKNKAFFNTLIIRLQQNLKSDKYKINKNIENENIKKQQPHQHVQPQLVFYQKSYQIMLTRQILSC